MVAIVAGAAVCVGLDALHVASHTTFYAHPSGPLAGLGLAWWVPLLFTAASAGVLEGARVIAPASAGRGAADPRALAGDGIAFVTAYACTSFLGAAPVALAVALTAFWAARVATADARVVGFCVATAACGAAAEIALSGAGLFGYHRPDVLGIPWWLPAIYLHAGVLGAGLQRALARR